MQNVLKRILSCGMALLMCLGITTVVHTTVTEQSSIAADAAVGTYYDDITATGGTQLLGQLHDLIVKTHKKYTSYEDCKTYGPKTDPGPNGGAMEFYTHESIMTFKGDTGTWNREHVWCQSLSGSPQLWGTSNGGSDMHHIRPSEARLNGTRGNNKYGEVTNGQEAYSKTTSGANSKLGGYVGGGVFEPLDSAKGDAARIIMYVYTHYNSASNVGGTVNSNGSGNLKFNYVMAPGSESDAIKLLLEWNKLDPVDDIERYRNEEVYKVQGNRNPFIDNSSYADAIWGGGTVTDPDTPVDKAKLTVTPSAVSLKVGQTQKLSVSFNPASAASSVNWNSDNPAVASVSSTGTVTANAEGTAKIYATSADDTSVKNYATVTVIKDGGGTVDPPSPTNSITITADSFSMSGSYGFHTWQEGGISGTAFVYGGNTNSLQFNSSKASQYLASTTAASSGITSVNVKLNSATQAGKDKWKLLTSNTAYGEVAGKPTDGNDQGTKTVTTDGVTWNVSGSDKYFALTYEATGACYLDSITVAFGGSGGDPVVPPDPPAVELKGIEIAPSTLALNVGQTKTLTVLCDPLNAKADVNWTTSDPSVATVSNGVVTAKGEGTATITATDKNNSQIKSTATVTVANGAVTPSGTATVTLASFTLTDNYGFKQWSQDGFGGMGYIFGGTATYPADKIQLSQKQASCYIASNVSAGNIKSITIKNPNKFSAEWTLLTSNTPYGEVAGVPDTGTNRGVKTVEANGSVTWTLDGTEKYFSLNATPDANGYAVYLESIVIGYENGQGGYEPDIDQTKLAAFHDAVTAIDTSETDLEVFAAKIKTAEDLLATLNADEKAEAIEDINTLSDAKLLYEILASQGSEEVNGEKVLAFMEAVEAIDNNGTVEEREAQIAAADEILATMNIAEKVEAQDEINLLNAAKIKLEQDKNKEPVTPPDPPVNEKLVAFHNAVAAIDNNASIEEREEKIAAADAIYVTLTANEKAEALDDIHLLTAAKTKLEQDKNGGTDPDPDIDQDKLDRFYKAVSELDESAPLEERKAAIDAAYGIADTFTADERKAAKEKLAELDAAYQKYQDDLAASGNPGEESANVKAFKTAVSQIPSSGKLEEKFNAIVKAIAAYQKLTAEEKKTVATEIATLNSAIEIYNAIVNAYNSSAETASGIAVGSLKNYV